MRELLVVRHAIALDRLLSAEQGVDDADRPLTDEGREKMEQAVLGLVRQQKELDAIYASPLLRAQQTGDLLAKCYPDMRVKTLDTLSPEYGTRELIRSLQKTDGNRIAVVGHEPQLSMLIASLLCEDEYAGIVLKKGGMAQLRFDDNVAKGEGVLQWLMTPKQLRQMGKSA
jgi:phosphohistidine phosphatase